MPATCRNPSNAPSGLSGPNAFQRQLLADPKVIDKLELKESRRRRALADKRHQFAKDYLDRKTMCEKVAESKNKFGKFDWMDVLSELEERNKKTLRQVAQLRKQLKYERFPLESWETEEAELEEAEFE
jgi:hypothetical protein